MNAINDSGNSRRHALVKGAILAGLLGLASMGFAAERPEFDSLCATGLAMGQKIKTDCSVNWTNPQDGKVYCFSNDAARSIFLQDATVNLRRAHKEFGRQ
jgi:hypothetical protein